MGWPVQVVDTTGSTNADLVAAARAGDRGPRILVARAQTAGRGRLGRPWRSGPRDSVSLSVLWRPSPPQQAWTWLPMVVGLGVLDALRTLGVGSAMLKWPNDVVVPAAAEPGGEGGSALHGLAKLAGILVEVVAAPAGPAVVAGVGLNLRAPGADLGVAAASLDGLVGRAGPPGPHGGVASERTASEDVTSGGPAFGHVATELGAALQDRLQRWDGVAGAAGDPGVREDYLRACSTIGRRVRVTTPAGTRTGTAVDIGPDGCLVLLGDVSGDAGAPERFEVSAGDVEHVR